MTELIKLINERIESLRPKLQDTSRRNPLINNVLSAKSSSFIRIVDEKPQCIFDDLVGSRERSMELVPLPPTDIDPPDENTSEFKNAFHNEQGTDELYQKTISKIDFEYDEYAIDKQEKAERDLKDRVRAMLEMPPRPRSDHFSDLINHAKSHGINPSSSLPSANAQAEDNRFEDDQLQTLLLPKTFQSRIGRILSKARMYEEERGLEVVYLVLGYIRWTMPHTDISDDFKSPILLLPVKLNKTKTPEGETYSISKQGDAIFNPSLAHKLKNEADIDLSKIMQDFTNEQFDVEDFFVKVQELNPKNMNWKVVRESSFGVYPFQGIDLYYDLDTDKCDFSKFSIVSELMLGKEPNSSIGEVFSEADIESDVGKKLVPHLVMDADSSQFIALLKLANNENVALEGPPGSGKSQTIVNAIANAIHTGKKVLFVAQKITALEVVYSRLQSLKLDHFVLPMMGGYGNSDEFYDAVKSRLELKPPIKFANLAKTQTNLEQQREKITEYISLLIQKVKGTSMTVHHVMGAAITYAEEIKELAWPLKSVSIDFQSYSQSFNFKDIKEAAASIAAWLKRLEDTKVPTESVWANADSLTMDTVKINNVFVSTKDALVSIDAMLSQLDNKNSNHLSKLLNTEISEIKAGLRFIEAGQKTKELDLLHKKIGTEKVKTALSSLKESFEALENISEKLKVPSEHLRAESLSNIILFNDFLNLTSTKSFKGNTVNETMLQINKKIAEKTQMMRFFEELNKIGIVVSPNKVSLFTLLISHRDLLNKINKQLKVFGLEGTLKETINGRKILRNVSELIGEKPLPTPKEIKSIRETIYRASIFSIFSKELRHAKEVSINWLDGYTLKSNKKNIIEALDKLLEESINWQSLEFSNHFERPDHSDRQMLDTILVALEELQTISEQLDASSSLIIRVLSIENWYETTPLFKNLDQDLDWDSIASDKRQLQSNLDFVKSNRVLLSKTEKLCLEIGALTSDSIKHIVSNSEKLNNLFQEIELSSNLLGPGFDQHEKVNSFFIAAMDYAGISTPVRESLVDIENPEVVEQTKKIMPLLEVISKCALDLIEAKHSAHTDIGAYLTLSDSIKTLKDHQLDQAGFNSIITRRSIFMEAKNQGLAELLGAVEAESNIESAESIAAATIVYQLQKSLDSSYGAALMEFNGTSLSLVRKRLQELDRELISVSPGEVTNAAISNSKPPSGQSFGRKSEYTDLALLLHELQKKRRTPPRKILKRAQGALTELFPCWMMVPTAVAQHLPREEVFDLVIIDEASQMTPENSISALMRGKHAMIAGDTNQLPPTNFFKGLFYDEDEDEDVATTEESILELANVQFHPKHRLLWHYRSRHEDLIAFSNHYIYDGELVIFPSPGSIKDELGISLIQVNGTFQRGINPAESQVMFEAILQFVKDSPHRSLGVAVMNQSQMEQIESLILREVQTNKPLSDYIDKWESEREGLEKFFVKNLENVQGDERDVIFIGTVYGRDPEGKFYQRFGPINGPSGKRRLNVLFSRAKEQIVTFSSIPMSDFHPSDTNEGAKLLKRWLEFSASRRLGETSTDSDRAGHPESPFEEHVIETIRSLGYTADPQVGVSSYFIDIGVKHDSYPFGYICGVECDGATYHSAKSARARDRLREEVLLRLGWDLYRIWSTDWFRDPLGNRELLKAYLSERLSTLLENVPETRKAYSNEIKPLGETLPDEDTVSDYLSEESVAAEVRESLPEVEVGDKVTIRYLDGPRAGAITKIWVQQKTDDPDFKLQDYRTVGLDSPLGDAVIEAQEGDIVYFGLDTKQIPVEIMKIES